MALSLMSLMETRFVLDSLPRALAMQAVIRGRYFLESPREAILQGVLLLPVSNTVAQAQKVDLSLPLHST
jgi:hypothetical protein